MLDIIKHFTVNDTEYPMAFTLNVMESIQEKYGTIENWSKVLTPIETVIEDGKEVQKVGEVKIKDLKWTVFQMINEGIDIENESKSEKRPFVTEKQVGRLISSLGISNITRLIHVTTNASTQNPNQ
jgi:hypothetical protein